MHVRLEALCFLSVFFCHTETDETKAKEREWDRARERERESGTERERGRERESEIERASRGTEGGKGSEFKLFQVSRARFSAQRNSQFETSHGTQNPNVCILPDIPVVSSVAWLILLGLSNP